MTIQALIIGINPAIVHLKQLKERMRDAKNELQELEEAVRRENVIARPILKERIKRTMERQQVIILKYKSIFE